MIVLTSLSMAPKYERYTEELRLRLASEGYIYLHSGSELSPKDGFGADDVESTHIRLLPLKEDEDGKSLPIDSIDAKALAAPMINVYYWIQMPE